VNRLRQRLDALLENYVPDSTRGRDPVDYVHRYPAVQDREIVGLISASLAFGNAVAAMQSIERALEMLGPDPAALVQGSSPRQVRDRLRGFVHRIYRGHHLATLLSQAGALQREHGTLGAAFASYHQRTGGDFRESLARGLWPISPSDLVIPVDTHVHRISRNLGLTDRRTASWATAEEITAGLRKLDPEDPVKYDFALCHLGVSRDCPSRPDTDKCATCVLRDVCCVWAERQNVHSAKKARELRL
jgi:hypothetical protein